MPKKPTRKMPRPMPRKRMLQEVERLSKLEAETREPIDPRMKEDPTYKMSPKDPNYKVAPRRTKPKNQFRDNPEDRFGEYRVSEAKKGGYLKDLLKDKKGTIIYSGKNKDYRILKPVPQTPKPSKKMSGGMVSVKTKMGRTKPTKIY